MRATLVAMGAAGLVSARASAQAVRVEAREALDGAPVAQALVGLRPVGDDPTRNAGGGAPGGLAAEGLTAGSGRRTLGVVAGQYRVEVRRIGFRPFVGPVVTVGSVDTVPVTVRLPRIPVTLAAVETRGTAACATPAAPEVVELWEAARTALATSAAARPGAAAGPAYRYERQLDAAGAVLAERRTPVERDAAGEGGARPFRAGDPDTLVARGFIVGTLTRGADFHGPDERVLLSDAFARTHCFAPARGGPGGHWLGVRFTPVPARRVADVAGTVWLDSATAEPRRVEFTYVWRALPTEARGLGGYTEFARLGSGEVAVSAWQIRVPHLAQATGGLRLVGYGESGGRLEAAAGEATAAAPAAPGNPRVVRVSGLVYDSLLGAPLPGALVTRAGTAAVALTDTAGRFVLDSVPTGRGALVFSHPALDSIGLSDIAVPVDVGLTPAPSPTILSTPSRATLWTRVCGTAAALPVGAVAPGGVLTGVVRDAATGAPIPNGVAAVAWTSVDTIQGRVTGRPVRRDVRADSGGTFRLCGVPVGVDVEVQGVGERSASGWAVTAVGPRGLAAVDLLVPPAAPTAGAGVAAASGATPGVASAVTVVVTGVVRDSLGAPRAGARVAVDGVSGLEAVTGADGAFRLATVPAGTQTFVVRAVGYAPQTVSVGLRTGAPEPVEITLRRVVRLAAVTVSEARRAANARLVAQIAHRQRTGLGSVVDSAVIGRAPQLRTAFTRVPFTTVRANRDGTWGLAAADGCPLYVALDGQLARWEAVVDLSPDVVLAIEVYRRLAQVPAELQGLISQATATQGRGCGLALVWTRAGR